MRVARRLRNEVRRHGQEAMKVSRRLYTCAPPPVPSTSANRNKKVRIEKVMAGL